MNEEEIQQIINGEKISEEEYETNNSLILSSVELARKGYVKIDDLIAALEKCKICSNCKRYDCGHEDWMMISLNNIKKEISKLNSKEKK